jgi:hypothetical protein
VVINFAHPRPVKWDIIINAVRLAVLDALGMDNDRLPLIPLCEWFDRLMAKAESVQPEDLEIMVIISSSFC